MTRKNIKDSLGTPAISAKARKSPKEPKISQTSALEQRKGPDLEAP